MLVKLVACHTKDYAEYANEAFEPIYSMIADGISDWEEIDNAEFQDLISWVNNFNYDMKISKKNTWDNKYLYLVLVKPENITAKFAIKEQVEKMKRSQKELENKIAENKKKMEKIRLEREKKKEEKERKKLEELKKKFGEL